MGVGNIRFMCKGRILEDGMNLDSRQSVVTVKQRVFWE
jgi:hypothetical protein